MEGEEVTRDESLGGGRRGADLGASRNDRVGRTTSSGSKTGFGNV